MNFTVPMLTTEFYIAAAPLLLLCVTGMIALLFGVSKSASKWNLFFVLNIGSIALALIAALCNYNATGGGLRSFLSGGYLGGKLGDFGQVMILGIALVISFLMRASYLKSKFYRGEVIALFHMVLVGMLTMVSTDDLITLFVGLEMASIGVYALIGYTSPNKLSQEASIKYFVLGSIAAAILLFGFAFLYAATGTLHISEISATIGKVNNHHWVELGTLLTLAGIGFKMALVPFHMWTPDAYEGSPTGLTAFMATAMKVMIMIAALRIFEQGLNGVHGVWLPAVGFMAAASMLFANIMALAQQSLKRILAYSSIAHSGYMALAIASMSGTAHTHQVPSILFYLISYVVVSLGAFGIIMWLENERCENIIVDDLSGLAKKHPWAAFALAVFMFSLGGMPPTVGFISKLYIFNAALSNDLIALVVIAVLGSTISLYYYLRIIVRMYMMEANPALDGLIKPVYSRIITGVVATAVVLILAAGTLVPETFMNIARSAAGEITGG